VQGVAQGPGFVGLAHRLLHLAEDLRLAEHHRIEAARHAKGMPRDARILHHVSVVEQVLRADAADTGEPVDRRPHQLARLARVGGAVQLGAVAGG
jgi:hypothetical protein